MQARGVCVIPGILLGVLCLTGATTTALVAAAFGKLCGLLPPAADRRRAASSSGAATRSSTPTGSAQHLEDGPMVLFRAPTPRTPPVAAGGEGGDRGARRADP